MRRRRRSGGTWLPVLPTFNGEEAGSAWYGSYYTIPGDTGPGAFPSGVDAIALIPDQTASQETGAADFSLRDYVEGQEYTLKRVVGKINVSYSQTVGGDTYDEIPANVIVGAGLCVLPVGDGGTTAANEPAIPDTDYNPLLAENSQAPWLWRRTWVLCNTNGVAGTTTVGSGGFLLGPQANWQNGDGYSGTHIDTKGTARRIRREERIFFVISATPMIRLVGGEQASRVFYSYDMRFFGAMRKARNQSTFK